MDLIISMLIHQRKTKAIAKSRNKKEVKNDKQKIESKLRKLGIPASYVGVTAIIITIIASQIGVCD